MLDETFLSQWTLRNEQYIDSCAYERNGVPYDIIDQGRKNKFRLKLFQILLQEKGSDFGANKFIIFEEYVRTMHYTDRSYFGMAIWFDDEDNALYYTLNDETGLFEKQKIDYVKENNIFFDEPELGCCYKYYESTILGCEYLSVFEANKGGTFDLTSFCLRYTDLSRDPNRQKTN